MKEIHILVTGVGRRVELMQAFRQAALNLNINLKLYGADMAGTAPALMYCDYTRKVCCGTCLGAVRNQNFIPWDHDADVFIYANDIKKLLEVKSEFGEGYFLQGRETDPEFNYSIYRLRDSRTTCIEKCDSKDLYKEKRRKLTNYLYLYQDGKSCERIVEFMNL